MDIHEELLIYVKNQMITSDRNQLYSLNAVLHCMHAL